MLRIEHSQPFVGLIVNRNSLLSRRSARIFNRDRNIRDAATALLVERYENEAALNDLGDEEQSPLIKFLEWLIEHQEEIRAFIEMIISLFNAEKKVINV